MLTREFAIDIHIFRGVFLHQNGIEFSQTGIKMLQLGPHAGFHLMTIGLRFFVWIAEIVV